MMKLRLYWMHLLLFACLNDLIGDVWYVSTNGSDANDGTSWLTPFLTISNAVSKANNGDTVLVSNGVYGITTQVSVTKGILLRSVMGH